MNRIKRIEPNPIIDALFEMRFDIDIEHNAVFGYLHQLFKFADSKITRLPILQLPDKIREADPNLIYRPHYKIQQDEFIIQIGPRMIAIGSYPKYVGWDKFSKKILFDLEKIERLDFIKSITRIALRYINFFENNFLGTDNFNVFDSINLSLELFNNEINLDNTFLKTEINNSNFNSLLQIGNNVIQNNKNGSIIDIDTYMTKDLDNFFTNSNSIIEEAHDIEKRIFFSLLKEEFLNKFQKEEYNDQ